MTDALEAREAGVNHRRKGKIARLPKAVRDSVNLMLEGGSTYPEIIRKLDAMGHPGILEPNLSAWFHGGHEDWKEEREKLDEMRLSREAAFEIAREGEGDKMAEANIAVAATQLFETLRSFDLTAVRKTMKNDPEMYLATLKEVARVCKPALEFNKYRESVAERKRQIEAVVAEGKSKGGFSSETIEKIERELRLL